MLWCRALVLWCQRLGGRSAEAERRSGGPKARSGGAERRRGGRRAAQHHSTRSRHHSTRVHRSAAPRPRASAPEAVVQGQPQPWRAPRMRGAAPLARRAQTAFPSDLGILWFSSPWGHRTQHSVQHGATDTVKVSHAQTGFWITKHGEML